MRRLFERVDIDTLTTAVQDCEAFEQLPHHQDKIHVNKVAALCHMEIFTFSRHFKKEHGITFRDYLIRHRIAKAKELLQNPHTSITSVTLTVGFNDFSHFARTFQQIVGMNPSQYRANRENLSD